MSRRHDAQMPVSTIFWTLVAVSLTIWVVWSNV